MKLKKLVIFFLANIFLFHLSAYDLDNLDFSIAPKTQFTQEKTNKNLKKGGLVEPEETSIKNKKDVAMPDIKLLRGFERSPKTDAFGDTLPDSFLFHRQTLKENQKSAYDEMYKAVINAEEKVNIISRVTRDEFSEASSAVYYDNPELFWWAGCTSWWYNSDGMVTSVEFEYLFSPEELKEANKLFFNRSLPVIFYANLLDNDMDKIKYVHDYICLSTVYDDEAYAAHNTGGKLQTAYSTIVEYKTVCAGYARAFAYYMQQLHIPCVVVRGNGHAWNFIEVNGDYYQLDVTWDDGYQNPPYFNLPHSEMQKISSHSPEGSSVLIIKNHPTKSDRMTYKNYFGDIPEGLPYTYKEFNNLAEDIYNPAFAELILQ